MSTIRWSPYSSIVMNEAVTSVVFGSLGSGKTFFLITLALNELAMGRRIIAIDPKNDFQKVLNINPEVHHIDVNHIKEGALNPFTFLDEIDSLTILTIIELLVGKLTDEKRTAITPIIQDFVTKNKTKNEYRDMSDVAEYLFSKDNEHAQAVGNDLQLFQDSKYGKLIFTKETNLEPLVIDKKSSLIITLHGMALPDEKTLPENYNAEERLTSTIVFLLAKKLRSILTEDNKKPTVLFCDEAHLLFSNLALSKLIEEFMSLGRSLKTATLLSSQGANRFPDISRYVSSKFMFKNSLPDADLFLEKFDNTKHKLDGAIDKISVSTKITELKKGQCFFIDSQNRSGFIQINPIYPIESFDIRPLDDKEVDSES